MSKHEHLAIPPWMIPKEAPDQPCQSPLPAPPPMDPRYERNRQRDDRPSERGEFFIRIGGGGDDDEGEPQHRSTDQEAGFRF